MPKNVLPAAARVLPKSGQTIWMRNFNEELDKGTPEDEAAMVAWAAVKRAGFSKNSNGKWSKSMDMMSTNFELNDDGSFELGVPLIKIDVKNRIVGGFATLNNVDEAGDLLDADASKKAFGSWFGNIREMHQKEAVGKAVDWKPDTYTDDDTGETYEGIWVNAKISKGAENTWQKVLDGTLAGFSVGGATLEKERILIKNGDETRQAWKITDYRLTELSLVDNPCNKLAAFSLVKSIDGGYEMSDDLDGSEVEKVYNGSTGEFADLREQYNGVVAALEALRDAAIAENADDLVASVSGVLGSFRWATRMEGIGAQANCEECKGDGCEECAEETTEGENVEKNEEIKVEENSLEKVDSATTGVEELSDTERGVFRKFIEFIRGETVEEAETLSNEEGLDMNEEQIAKAIEEAGEELTKGVDDKFTQVGDSLVKIEELLKAVATTTAVEELQKDLEGKIEALVSRVETVEASGAIKKSGDDAGNAGEELKKSDEGFWGDSILPEFARSKH